MAKILELDFRICSQAGGYSLLCAGPSGTVLPGAALAFLFHPNRTRLTYRGYARSMNPPYLFTCTAHKYVRDALTATPDEMVRMGYGAVIEAVAKLKHLGYKPISMVDDITNGCDDGWPGGKKNSWFDNLFKGLVKGCLEAGISCSGGEMAGMPDSYHGNYVGVIVFALGVKR